MLDSMPARTTAAGPSVSSSSGHSENNWSAKFEYLYIDFGDGPTEAVSAAFNIVSGRMSGNIVRAGLNYRFY